MKAIEDRYYTKEEYFSLVEESDLKIEYHKGRIYAMAGGTSNHNIISGNILTALNNALTERDCLVYNSDQQLAISQQERYVYADVAVVCGERAFEDQKETRLINPSLIFEVLSDSTKDYDKTTKFHLYCRLPSFKEYALVHSDRIFVESFYKEESGLWRISSAFSLQESIHLYSLSIDLPLSRLYNKITGLKEEKFI